MRFVGGVVGGVIGSAFGFPQLGYAIGSLIGGSFEKQATVKNVGPRLDDLSGPTSNIIGRQIPIVYGTDRISLAILWTSPKKEKKHTSKESSGGKGGGGQTVKTTTYTYSISFAAGICEGPIVGIRRIWINKVIVYDLDQSTIADPDLNFTLYTGTENQLPDSTMEGYLGEGNVPAYRGLAYIVFKNLQLERYGNNVPVNIEVEVVKTGALTSTLTNLYTSSSYYNTGGDQVNTANFIVQSPNTGIIWSSPATSTGNIGAPIVYGFDTGGNVVGAIYPDIDSVGSWYSDGHLGANGAFIDIIGQLILISYDFWETGSQMYMGIRMWDEEGTKVYGDNNILLKESGSFIDYRTYYAKILVDGVHLFTNIVNSVISNIFMMCPRSYLVINLDGTYSVAYQISTLTYSEADIADNVIVSNSNYPNPDSGSRIIGYLRGMENSIRVYENDPYNIRATPIGTIPRSGTGIIGRSEILISKPDPDLPALEDGVTKIYVNIAELQGVPGSLGTLDETASYCCSELILESEDSFAFIYAKTSTSGSNYWLMAFYKTSVETDYTFVSCENSNVGLEIKSFMPTYDNNTNNMNFFTSFGTDRIISFNIITREWETSNVTGWTLGDLSNFSNMTIKPATSPNIYFSRESGSAHNLYKLSLYNANKTATTLGTIVQDQASRVGIDTINDLDTTLIDNLPIKGYSIRTHNSAKANIAAALPVHLVDPVESEWKLKFEPFKTTSIVLSQNDLGAVKIGDEVEDKYSLEKRELDEIPKALAIHYSGFANNYLKTQQSSIRNGFIYNHDNSEIVEIPVVMEDNFAAQLVEKMLYILWISATTFKISLPIKYAYLEPTDIVNFYIAGENKSFVGKITSIEREDNKILEISGEQYLSESIVSYVTGALEDNNNVQSIAVISFTYVQPIDFRPLYEVDNITLQYNSIYITAAGYSNSWTAGYIYYSLDGEDFKSLTTIDDPVIFGKLNSSLTSVYNPGIMQYTATLDISVLGTRLVESITDTEMKQGKNTMIIFDSVGNIIEVLQFRTATPSSTNKRYTLSNFWRKRYNTQGYGTPTVGHKFLVVDDITLKQVNISADYINKNIFVKGVSSGQYLSDVVPKTYTYTGQWSSCPKPVHLTAKEVTSGNIQLDWHAIRRFKAPLMFSDADLYHSEEKFKVEVYDFSGTLITSFSDILAKTYTYVLDNGFTQGDYMTFRVYQYSDIHQYNTEYAEVSICTDYDGLINTIAGTVFGYYKFNELYNATTLIDSSVNSDDLIGSSLPVFRTQKGIEIINKINGSFRQGSGVFTGTYDSTTSDYASYSFWIRLDKKPSADHIIFRFNGSALYGEHTVIITSAGVLTGKHVGNNTYWVTKTLTLGRTYHIVFRVNSDNARLYVDNVLASEKTFNSGRWQVDGFFEVGDATSHGILYQIDELITFKSAISTADINILYKAGLSQLGDRAKWQQQI